MMAAAVRVVVGVVSRPEAAGPVEVAILMAHG